MLVNRIFPFLFQPEFDGFYWIGHVHRIALLLIGFDQRCQDVQFDFSSNFSQRFRRCLGLRAVRTEPLKLNEWSIAARRERWGDRRRTCG
jgi:hypothetical protein